MSIQLLMPQLGESVVEGTVTKWLVREGDSVAREQVLVEIGTDKADSELPSPSAGRIARIVVPEGRVVRVGQPLCEIEVTGETARRSEPPSADTDGVVERTPTAHSDASPAASRTPDTAPEPIAQQTDARASRAEPAPSAAHASTRNPASPWVRRLALERGVDVSSIQGTGGRGRITREDVLHAAPGASGEVNAPSLREADPELVALLNRGALVPVPGVGFGAYRVPPYRVREGDQVVPFTRRRRLLAHHMAYSKITAPHVVAVAEVDLHRTSLLREAHKDRYKKEGAPLTILSFVCHATVRALREHPTMNARVLDDAYVLLRDINLGIAVDAPDGLIVPNVKRADELSLRGLAKAIDEIAQRARAGKSTADDLANSSFSVSNPGLKGNLFGGAIIAQPNVGILRMGKIQKRVVVVDIHGEDVLAVHPVMYLALSYDHRIVDGVLGNAFLYRVSELLEKGEFDV